MKQAMTVQEVIDTLLKIDDKNMPVFQWEWDGEFGKELNNISINIIENPESYPWKSFVEVNKEYD